MIKISYRFGIALAVCFLYLAAWISSPSAMELNVVTMSGQSFKINANSEETVKSVKEKIYVITELSYLNQSIFKGSQEMKDKNTLASYSIKNGDTLYVRYGVENAPVSKNPSGLLPIIIMIAVILLIGVYFMRKKPSADTKP